MRGLRGQQPEILGLRKGKKGKAHPPNRLVSQDMPICLDPLFLQAQRFLLWYVDKATVNPVYILGPRNAAQRGAICTNTAMHDSEEYLSGQDCE
jgi:hypothetical protein